MQFVLYRLEGCPACEAVLGSWEEARRRRPSYATTTVEAAEMMPFERQAIERFPTFAVRREQKLLKLWDGGLRSPSAIVAWMDEVVQRGGVSARRRQPASVSKRRRRPRRARSARRKTARQ